MNKERPERPSAYLVGKCEGLSKIIDFFASNSGSFGHTVKDKRIVFLSQIDFWDWEIDELIYSIDSFAERAAAWESCATIRECMAKLNFPVDPMIVYKIESDRGWNAYKINKSQTVPPMDSLNDVIIKWNKLLKICENTLFIDNKELEEYGCKFVKNLDKYRKKERV